MILPTGTRRNAESRLQRSAFTLIELILVMALLVIVLGAIAPALSRFFHGRNLDAEANRFVSLTRYAQSRAISEGTSMRLWIDTDRRTYGLQPEYAGGRATESVKNFRMDPDLAVEILRNTRMTVNRSTPGNTAGGRTLDGSSTALAIRILADGGVDESSPERIRIYEDSARRSTTVTAPRNQSEVWIMTDVYRLKYEIATNHLAITRH